MWWPAQMVWTYITGRLPAGPLFIACNCGAHGVADVPDPAALTLEQIDAIRSVAITRCNVCEPGQGHVNLAAQRDGVPQPISRDG